MDYQDLLELGDMMEFCSLKDFELFLQKIPWHKSEELASSFDKFVVNLLLAHNYFSYVVLQQLFTCLIPGR